MLYATGKHVQFRLSSDRVQITPPKEVCKETDCATPVPICFTRAGLAYKWLHVDWKYISKTVWKQKLQVCADFIAIRARWHVEGQNLGLQDILQVNQQTFCLPAGVARAAVLWGFPRRIIPQSSRQGCPAHLLHMWEPDPNGLDRVCDTQVCVVQTHVESAPSHSEHRSWFLFWEGCRGKILLPWSEIRAQPM